MLEACPSARTSSISRAWGSPRARAAGSTCTCTSSRSPSAASATRPTPDVVPGAARRLAHDGQRLGAAAALRGRGRRARACAAWSPPSRASRSTRARSSSRARSTRSSRSPVRERRRRARHRGAGRATRWRSRCRRRSPAAPDCAGLCAHCGANLNDEPEHAHEPGPTTRWAKLARSASTERSPGAVAAFVDRLSGRRRQAEAVARRAASQAPRRTHKISGARDRRSARSAASRRRPPPRAPRTATPLPFSPPWPSRSRSSRTRARTSAVRRTRSPPAINACPQCRQPRRPHRVCDCGFYAGREVVHVHDHDHDHAH